MRHRRVIPGRKKGGVFYVNVRRNSIESTVFLPRSSARVRGCSPLLRAMRFDNLRELLQTSIFAACSHRPTISSKHIHKLSTDTHIQCLICARCLKSSLKVCKVLINKDYKFFKIILLYVDKCNSWEYYAVSWRWKRPGK